MTDYDPAQDNGWKPADNLGTTTRDVSFMNRDLGALAAGNSLAGRGLFYQWGRKDPFPPKDNVGSFSIVQGPVTIVQAIENPGTFYWVTYNTNRDDWLATQDDTLWGGDETNPKTIYDPCPAGWRVPFSGAGTSSPWSDFGSQAFTTGNDGGMILGSSAQSYWPAAGCRIFTTGALFNPGVDGSYWSATVTGASAYNLGFSSGSIYPSYTFNRAFGFSVRCVKE